MAKDACLNETPLQTLLKLSASLTDPDDVSEGECSVRTKDQYVDDDPVLHFSPSDAHDFEVPPADADSCKISIFDSLPAETPDGWNTQEQRRTTTRAQAAGYRSTEPPQGYRWATEPPQGYRSATEPPQGYRSAETPGPSVKEGDEATSEATYEAGEEEAGEEDAEQEEITLMLRNLPCRLGHDDLVAAIDGVGLAGEYDFLHLPAGLRGKYPRSMGYAFVHFKTVEQAATFAFRFRDFRFQGTNSNKSCTVDLASMQGYKSHKRPIANKAQVQQKAFQKAVMRMVESTQLLMSTPGTIKQFFPAKGFGFIQPDAGGDSVFFHVHHNGGDDAFADVTAGDRVMYDATWDERRGQYHAINVTGATITLSIAGSRPLVPPGFLFSAPGSWDASGGQEGLGPEMSAWPGEHWMPGAGQY